MTLKVTDHQYGRLS